MSICPHYSCKKVRSVSKVQTANRNPRKPKIHDVKKCSHPESMHKPGTITQNVPCEGDITHCIIPEHLR